ncbi:MAG: ADP-ribosyl-[dinitrogen reductase] hydrolase [Magnetococcales bacterium]|nr:ADP-ribosyl-[dinitrogen reductase] hydrolase [Magnetococcales bacterium]NGZ25909.1 ADP-ribosyl-[dinitrogen reductase] hydrolase [Magnetococcales bacterium]
MFWTRNLISPHWTPLQRRAVGACLGLAAGDALGATVEFMTPREIQHRHGVHREITGGGWLNLPAGQVTDDTTMSLALGEAILANGRVDPQMAAKSFDGWMRTKPVDIGNTVRRGILHFRRTGLAVAPASEQDAGNGSCMRVLPVILACHGSDDETLALACRHQGRVTHHNPVAEAGTLAIARLVRMALAGTDKKNMLEGPVRTLVTEFPIFRFRIKPEMSNPSGYIVDTLRVVFQSFFDNDTFEDAVTTAVNLGGDADTTGAITGMLAGACCGVEGIPRRWLKALDAKVVADSIRQGLTLLEVAPVEVEPEDYQSLTS